MRGCTARFGSDLVRNTEDRLSRDVAQFCFIRLISRIEFLRINQQFCWGLLYGRDKQICLITRSLDLLCRRNDLLSRRNELLCRRNDLLSRRNKLLCRRND